MNMFLKFKTKLKQKIVKNAPYHGLSKKAVVILYTLFLRITGKLPDIKKNINKAIKESRPYLKRNSKKFKTLYEDVFYSCFIYGCLPKEYFSYEFNMLSHEGRSSFVTKDNKYTFYTLFNSPNYAEYLNKKTETHRKFGEFYGRDVVALIDDNDFSKFCDFVAKHPKFIYKPAEDHGGNGIKIYDSTQFCSIEDLFTVLIYKGPCVVEELIKQGAKLASIHEKSINTVRFVTYRTESGEVIPQWSFLRMGSGNSITDNMSGGGISAKIDIEAGIICDYGRDYKRNKYLKHPDSGVQLIGFELPEWDKAMELVKKLVNTLPDVKFIGWDLAYSEKGWILVEGNSKTQCVAPQVTSYGGMLYTYKNMRKIFNSEKGNE